MKQVSSPELYFKKLSRLLILSDAKAFFIALTIMGLWFYHLIVLLPVKFSAVHPSVLFGAILLQTFLNTGLFVTTHDAIHGLIYPTNRFINNSVGSLCALAYAFLSYETLCQKHWLHHRYPMSTADPDFHGPHSTSFLMWYLQFMRQYWGWQQFMQLASIVGVVGWVFQLSPYNLILFWGVPLLLSSLQLFYFGTYRPHHNIEHSSTHCARSDARPWLLSLLACYHFGYHQEHHERPDVPWWKLPTLYKLHRPYKP